MAKYINYSIHDTALNAFEQTNPNTLDLYALTGSDGDIETAWDALTAEDGSGGYIDDNLVHSAKLYEDGLVSDEYTISAKYDFAYNVGLVSPSGDVDPVSGDLGLESDAGGTVTSVSAGTTGLSVTNPTTTPTLAGTLVAANGGTGRATHTAYAVLCGGTTTTAAQQSVASVGTTGQVLTSNGAGALPTFQTAATVYTFVTSEVPSGTKNSSNVTFTLAHAPVGTSLALYVNGVRQVPTTDYSISTLTITMVVAPDSTDTIIADYHY
jgi:hypothetical protein